tara:strand:+ start:180 stop:725 length:546 start_codon:yes stop_codon:yes gene_type:complete
MELKVVIDKKFAFMIFGAILILAGAIYGYAQAGIAPNPGHLFEELEGVQAQLTGGNCGTGEVVQSINNNGAVTCKTDDVGSENFGLGSIGAILIRAGIWWTGQDNGWIVYADYTPYYVDPDFPVDVLSNLAGNDQVPIYVENNGKRWSQYVTGVSPYAPDIVGGNPEDQQNTLNRMYIRIE